MAGHLTPFSGAKARGVRPNGLAHLLRHELDLAHLAVADERDLDRGPDQLGDHQPLEVVDTRRRLAGNRDDQVLRPHAGARGGTALYHGHDLHGRAHVEPWTDAWRQR